MKSFAIRMLLALAIALLARPICSAAVGEERDPERVSLPFLPRERTYLERGEKVGNSTWGAMTAVEASIHRLKQLASDMLKGIHLRNSLPREAARSTAAMGGEGKKQEKEAGPVPESLKPSRHGWAARAHSDRFAPFMPSNAARHPAPGDASGGGPAGEASGLRALARKSPTPLTDAWRRERLASASARGSMSKASSQPPHVQQPPRKAAPALQPVSSPQVLSCVCDGLFKEGDRVHIAGLVHPFGRTTGTVLGGTDNGNLNIQWDGWTGGHTGNCAFATCGTCEESATYSRWFTRCSDVRAEQKQ